MITLIKIKNSLNLAITDQIIHVKELFQKFFRKDKTFTFCQKNKEKTHYCYSDAEKNEILNSSNSKFEITRFKGLGEISPDEFKNFIGDDMRLDPVVIDHSTTIENLLSFYMGKNTPDRQQFIIENLKVELDLLSDNSDE